MNRYFALLVIVLAGLAALGGYWPEHRQRQALEEEVASLQVELAEAQARVRLGDLLGQHLAAEDAVAAQNYGQAQALSSKFFDAVRTETMRTGAERFRDPLEKVVRLRDGVTASLTRSDPQALTLLREGEALVRNALGFPRPATL